ncbi:related to Acetamidase regulatory protein [Phialocephala subalpina]|uniref:Related to Acetamidase regulatory protein n=1 Tax=Phialocephala subalpina TaxID=576137 RepID=A0A1L7XPM3_9HELO|nr:related to Acetamidase regulatory protein [Phialocephala subalpina]
MSELIRMASLTDSTSSGRHGSTQRHKPSRAACSNCHDRKVRCDAHKRGFPCSTCINSQRANCRIHEKKRRIIIRSSDNPVPIRRKSHNPANASQGQLFDRALTSTSLSTGSSQDTGTASSTPKDDSGRRHLVEFISQKDIGHRSIQRGVRITYVGKDVSNINFLVRQLDGGENETVYHFPSDEIARQYITHEPDRMPREAFILPDQALADELVEAYFTHINPGCPIVDEDIFMGQYRGRNPADPPSLLVLQAILLVGAHVLRERPDRDVLKATFFRRAKMLFDARLERNRDVVVQAALLLTVGVVLGAANGIADRSFIVLTCGRWHSDGAEDIAANAWHWVGVAARIAMGLGMHRDAGSSTLIHHDMRTWRRTWWILVQFDVTVSLSYGRPQAINLDECDVQSLSDSDFEGCGPNVQIDYVKKHTELCLLISKIVKERFGLRVSPEDRKAALGNGDEALAIWCLMLPSHLQMVTSDMSLWASSLHLTYNNFLILLHRPHPRASQRSEDVGRNDSDICSSAAIAVASIFEDLRQKDRIKYLWISDINALFTAMIQVSVELRFSNPVLAINALRRFDSTLLSLRKLAEYWINAESILRFFEESSHVQHGIRLGKASGEQDQTQNTSLQKGKEPAPESSSATARDETWTSNGRTDLDMLAAAADAARDNTTAMIQNPPGIAQDWNGILPQTDTSPEDFAVNSADLMNLDNEWREIYWQEPGLSGSFPDGFWG